MFTLLSTLGLLSSAYAQDAYNAHGFNLVASDSDQRDLLTVWRPEAQVPMSIGGQALFEYADQPLIMTTSNSEGSSDEVLLDQLLGVNLGLSWGIHERVGLAAAMPLWFSATDGSGDSVTALGDLRLAAPIGLVLPDAEDGGFGLSLVPFVSLPTGDEEHLLGNTTSGGGANVALGWSGERLAISGNLGFEQTEQINWENLRGGLIYHGAVGASYDLSEALAVRGELTLSTAQDEVIDLAESPSEALVSLRGRVAGKETEAEDPRLVWTVGAAKSVISGAGAADFRLFAGIGTSFGKGPDDPPPPPPRCVSSTDTLLDINASRVGGVPVDAQVRFMNGPEDMDPISLGSDGRTTAHVAPGTWQLEVIDGKATHQATVTVGACETGRVDVQFQSRWDPLCDEVITLNDVNFEYDKDTLLPDAYPVLWELALVLKERPECRLEVGGHTDESGSDVYNQGLSERRMVAVVNQLVKYEIDPSRLVARGYGESQLLVTRPTEESCSLPDFTPEQRAETNHPYGNCAVNRRVELTPIQPVRVAERR